MSLDIFLYKAIELAVALLVAVLSLFLAIKVFGKLTRGIDEWAELKRGNMAVAIVMSAIIISIAIMVTLLFNA